MDGTLIDSQHDITVSINHVRKEHHGLEPLTNAYVVEAINRYQRNLSMLFYGTYYYHARDKALFEEHYHDQCIQNPVLYEGIKELLTQLAQEGIKVSVATNAPSTFARRMLAHLEVFDIFDHIIGADMVASPKPDKEMLHRILEHYGFEHGSDSAWMVGDNSKDMEAARNAEICSIFATWGFSPTGEGDHIASKPENLHRIIAKG